MRIVLAECTRTAVKNHPPSAGSVSYHRKESDREQHRRNKRGECDGNHDAALAAAIVARLSLCHVRSAPREHFSGFATMRSPPYFA